MFQPRMRSWFAGRQDLVAGVDEQQAVVGVEGGDVAERGVEGGAVGHLRQAEVLGDRMVPADSVDPSPFHSRSAISSRSAMVAPYP